ncbi:MAG: acetyl-CoA carboxylase biotin carboxyl carrier protein subunit [Bacteroidales bacterium]
MKKFDNLGTLNINSTLYHTRLGAKYLKRKPYKPADPGLVLSFIPGTIIDIFVSEGQKVEKGDELLILDAMKMQNRLKSEIAGTVESITVKKGDRVAKGHLLLKITPAL